MKQVLQDYQSGKLEVVDVPPPAVRLRSVLVRNACSLISAGTERASVELARASLLGKARARPDLVRKVLDNLRQEGFRATVDKVRARLSEPKALGYSCAGVVLERSPDAAEFAVGDRVACAGAGYASHAEVVCVPAQLTVRLPEAVSFEEAAFTTLGAITLHGIRQAEVAVGDRVGVIGLGLVGLLTLQLLKVAGARVFGVDIAADRVRMAAELGATAVDPARAPAAAEAFTAGLGLDRIIITAASPTNQPLLLAAQLARDKAIIVIVGDVRLDFPRSPFYEKELDLRMSRSYGPGRYDPLYELAGLDYPAGYVRWTERRNLEAFVELLAEKKVQVHPLITHRYPIAQAVEAYAHILPTAEATLAVLLDYPPAAAPAPSRYELSPAPVRSGALRVGFIGAGHFAQAHLLPHLKGQRDVTLVGVCNATGPSARRVGERFGFRYCTTSTEELLNDPDINTIFIATRHDLHAPLLAAALARGKNVFVEKPLAIRHHDLARLADAYQAQPQPVQVGFNRRYAPAVKSLKEFFASIAPLTILYRIHAGALPPDHWLYDPEQGGGRILGEVCHFVDLARYLVAASPLTSLYATSSDAEAPAPTSSVPKRLDGTSYDSVQVNLKFANGSLATIVYSATGDPKTAKEYLELLGGARTAVLDNFETLILAHQGKQKRLRLPGKGHREEVIHFLNCLRDATPLAISFPDALATTEATFAILESLRQGQPIALRL
ncbi:MAG: bi-domain-containing oxidoreductase [Terriglobia bacterium]